MVLILTCAICLLVGIVDIGDMSTTGVTVKKSICQIIFIGALYWYFGYRSSGLAVESSFLDDGEVIQAFSIGAPPGELDEMLFVAKVDSAYRLIRAKLNDKERTVGTVEKIRNGFYYQFESGILRPLAIGHKSR